MINQGHLKSEQSDSQGDKNNAHTNNRDRCGISRGRKSKSPTRQGQALGSQTRQNRQRNKNSRSPKRKQKAASRSPNRSNVNNKSRSPTRRGVTRNKKPAAMTVIVNRCDLWDSAAHFQPDECFQQQVQHCVSRALPYRFENAVTISNFPVDKTKQPPPPPGMEKPEEVNPKSVATARVPHHVEPIQFPIKTQDELCKGQKYCDVIDTSIPNPHDPNVVHDKYWAQRRRLFSRFDQGIQLDAEGWYSVTPEIIADHVAERVSSLVSSSAAFQSYVIGGESDGIVLLDGFCGCGGNAIAFGKLPSNIVSKIVCVDTDRSKLLKAAHNASLYGIPKDKLIFVQCNAIFILKYCYRNGEFILDQPQPNMPQHMPPPVVPTIHAGYHVGGLEMLPSKIDLAFFDPPWGGIDYEILGKNGYDLERNMKIQVDVCEEDNNEDSDDDCGLSDDFFDTFAAPKVQGSKKTRKKTFNQKTEGEFVNGKELVKLAAEAVRSRVILLDLPRNTSKNSLGSCALAAGYRGNLKLEEHYLNGRLKTVTAYLGSDYSSLINESDAVNN
mmetsp:Transcript_2839/g.7793  ORF Transcript_2839/g.7793 Transcript_2839/m.7793 type:complete len:554 (-) Transcript_2839:169-1830(-)|eukprot:CAMPEP_0197194492 /NCGR_PEP_ID=MMETSP1423-20130617/29308_1 /TAXON_ID=476441 /ORGANISM="Pseudo-nitzschia heimii, Strain UNC1101" /LENGTH=553 /DNA_ID=CAMNT_0042647919 /DNA_START=37 /DNA_END=1698 /DNA_ORIENTATION=+